jgi:uncharacterized protein YjdB
MHALHPARTPLCVAIILCSLACVDRGDPTAPATSRPSTIVAAVDVRLPAASLEVGHVVSASATATDNAGQVVPSSSVQWSSSDTSVVYVTSGGSVGARKMGSATIYATVEGVSGQSALLVTDSVPNHIIVSPAIASTPAGGHVQLSARVTTETGRALPGAVVTWRAMDTRYLSVSPTGTVTGVAPGTTRIIAMSSAVADTAIVTVSTAAITLLSVKPEFATFASGLTMQLNATALDANGNQLTGRTVGWSSSDPSIASISASGVVTGAKMGDVTVTATSEGLVAASKVHVSPGRLKNVTVSPGSVGLVVHGTQQLKASFTDAAGNTTTGTAVTWASSNSSIAAVSATGVVTGLNPGSATISAKSSGVTGYSTLAVSVDPVGSVTVSPASVSLVSGDTRQFSTVIKDANGIVLTGQVVAWSSSNSSIITVSPSGLVTAKGAGSATVTAAAGGASGSASLSVSAGSVAAVTVDPPSASVVAGSSQQLTATLTDALGNTVAASTVVWASTDTSIIGVSASGLATASHVGTATVTATANGHSGKALFAVSVGPVSTIGITPASASVQVGNSQQLSATLADAEGNTITNQSIAWASSAPSVATISNTGLIAAIATGSASMTATAGGKSKSASITVAAAPTVAPPPPPPPPPPAPAPAPAPQPGVAAVWSDKFVGSVGVATHFSYWDLTPYGTNITRTMSAVTNAGFRFVRDALIVQTDAGWNNRYWGVLSSLTQQGVKIVLITQPGPGVSAPYANQSNLDTAVARIGTSSILAFEGPNEVDLNNSQWGGLSAYGANAHAYQAAMYQHAKQIAPSTTVIGLTTTSSSGSAPVGDLSGVMDFATMHPYPGGGLPLAHVASMESALSSLNLANKGWWVTETGYHTAPFATQQLYQPGVSETAQGKYATRLYLDYFNAGISHTATYELIDERADQTNAEMNYGLLHNDGSPKPAYTAIKNLLALLADPGSSYSPGTLNYSLSGAPSTLRQSLFQKRDGRFYLVLWNNVSVYDYSAKHDVSNANVPVTLTFGAAHSVSIYQPYTQAGAISASNGTSIALSVPDHPLVVEISP